MKNFYILIRPRTGKSLVGNKSIYFFVIFKTNFYQFSVRTRISYRRKTIFYEKTKVRRFAVRRSSNNFGNQLNDCPFSLYTVRICLLIRHAVRKDSCAAVRVDFKRLRVIENKTLRVDLRLMRVSYHQCLLQLTG
jgi:hypothetical protein